MQVIIICFIIFKETVAFACGILEVEWLKNMFVVVYSINVAVAYPI